MRTTRIDVGGNQAGNYATVTRRAGSSTIEVTLMTSTPGRFGAHTKTRTVTVNAHADKDELWMEAARLQRTLDGHRGTNGDVNDYFNLLATFAD